MRQIARRFDVAEHDARKRAFGRAGKKRIVLHERSSLIAAGRDDLADRIRWVSDQNGDGAGYDIASSEIDGSPRLIEVKTANGWERTRFHISRNELPASKEHRRDWCLVRLWTSLAIHAGSSCGRRWTRMCH
jgi:hypothetical protein